MTAVTDHKPFLRIYGKASSRTSARLERWCLRLIPYDMTLTYEPRHRNPADYMSRHPNNGEYIMIIIDDFTHYPEVVPLKTLTATKVIHETDTVFRRLGNPNILKTDNGPPFNSHEFASYMKDNGIKHHRITQLRWKERIGKRKSTSTLQSDSSRIGQSPTSKRNVRKKHQNVFTVMEPQNRDAYQTGSHRKRPMSERKNEILCRQETPHKGM